MITSQSRCRDGEQRKVTGRKRLAMNREDMSVMMHAVGVAEPAPVAYLLVKICQVAG